MKRHEPVAVLDVMAEERAATLRLLTSLTEEQFASATACLGWNVKDLVAHLVGDDLSNLSGVRDGYAEARFDASKWTELVGFVNARNEAWVASLRRLSPAVLLELLEDGGPRPGLFRNAGPGSSRPERGLGRAWPDAELGSCGEGVYGTLDARDSFFAPRGGRRAGPF